MADQVATEDDALWQAHFERCSALSDENNFYSVWSIYEVDDFTVTPFPNAKSMNYKNDKYWSGVDKDITVNLTGLTWLNLWRTADALIADSGDQHHIFIEDIRPSADDASILELFTGS